MEMPMLKLMAYAPVMYRSGNTGIMDGKMEGKVFVSIVLLKMIL